MSKMFNVAVLVKQKHGDLYKALQIRGWTAKDGAEFLKIPYSTMCGILNFRSRPPTWSRMGKKGKRKLDRFEQRLMKLTGKSFEDLFPDEVFNDEVMERARPVDFFVERDVRQLRLEPSAEIVRLSLPDSSAASDYEAMADAIKEILTDEEWRIFDMAVLESMNHRDIGSRLGVTGGAVSARLKTILKKIRCNYRVMRILAGKEAVLPDPDRPLGRLIRGSSLYNQSILEHFLGKSAVPADCT